MDPTEATMASPGYTPFSEMTDDKVAAAVVIPPERPKSTPEPSTLLQ
jgi:hypothetical protein